MAAFGWSAGDLVASIKIVIRIAGALKESGGAKADFQEATEFLFGLEITLHNLKSISPVLTIPSQEYTVQQEVKRISEPLKAFFTKVEKFDRCLGSGSKIGFFRTVPKKLQWAMGVSKEVISLRDRISIPMGSLGILLHTQNLHALSMLNQNLPQNISDKLACSIENTVSSSLRHELAVLGNSIHKYEQAQECMKQDIISAVDGAIIHNNNSLRTIGDQIGCIPQTISRQLNQHQSNENFENLGSNRMLKELITEQSHELRMLRGSLNTITNNCKPAPRGSTKELTLASKTSLSELKVVSARCIYLLALTLREIFQEVLLYVGPRFFLFLLALKRFGTRIPRLLKADSILFEDFLGRQRYLPVEFFQHYNTFVAFLEESFDGKPGQRYVFSRQYRLQDPKNNVINERKWHEAVAQRSNVTMSVILDTITDILVDGMACPRCLTADCFSKPGMNIQCPSCGLIYKTAALNISPVRENISSDLKLPVSRTRENVVSKIRSENGYNTTRSENAEPHLASSGSREAFDDSERLEEVKVGTKASEVKAKLEYTDVPQTKRQRVPFPQHDEDLKHFKRVQILDFSDNGSFSQLSVLNRFHESFARIKDDLTGIRLEHPSRLSDDSQERLVKFLSSFTFFQRLIQQISQHPSSSLLSPEADLDWWESQRFQAWGGSIGDITVKIKHFFRDTMVVYDELEKQGHPRCLEKFFQQKADMIHYLIIDLERLKSHLDDADGR